MGLTGFDSVQNRIVTQPELGFARLVKQVNQTINADYDVVAEAEAILAEAALATV